MKDEIERQVMQLFMAAGDRWQSEALGLPPSPPAPPEPTPDTTLTLNKLVWSMVAYGAAYIEVVKDGQEGIAFYWIDNDTIYFIPKEEPRPPSSAYVFEWPSGGHFPEGGHDDMAIKPEAQPPSVEWGNDLHLNDDLINASVAYKQAGDPSWPNPPDPDEASSTSSTKTAPLRANRALRRHPGGPLDVPNPWRKPRWTRS